MMSREWRERKTENKKTAKNPSVRLEFKSACLEQNTLHHNERDLKKKKKILP